MHLLSLARWLARKAVTAEWRAQGRKVQYINASEITEASNIYLILHRKVRGDIGRQSYFGHWQTRARSRPVVYFVR
jgi:hypothetical protein